MASLKILLNIALISNRLQGKYQKVVFRSAYTVVATGWRMQIYISTGSDYIYCLKWAVEYMKERFGVVLFSAAAKARCFHIKALMLASMIGNN